MTDTQNQEAWISNRLIEWLESSPRKPAHLAFTEGPLRQVAYAVESIVKARMEEETRALKKLLRAAGKGAERNMKLVQVFLKERNEARDAVKEAVAREREECAKIVESVDLNMDDTIEISIRELAEAVRAPKRGDR